MNLDPAAVHEAGHAVIAHYFRIPVHGLSVAPGPGVDGTVWFEGAVDARRMVEALIDVVPRGEFGRRIFAIQRRTERLIVRLWDWIETLAEQLMRSKAMEGCQVAAVLSACPVQPLAGGRRRV